MMPLGLTPSRLRPATSARRLEPLTTATWPPASLTSICVRGVDDRLAVAERRGLRDLRRLGDPHVERAVRDRDRRDLHVLADDDGAGAGVDDDARRRVGLDQQLADLATSGAASLTSLRAEQLDRARVALEGDRRR